MTVLKGSSLDRRICIERFETTYDDLNNPVQSWNLFLELPASKRDVSDSERFAAQQQGAEITTRFQVRWSQDVMSLNAKDRLILEDSRVYEIVGVKELGRREGVEITAVSRID